MDDRESGEVWTIDDADVTMQSLLDDSACPALLRRALSAVRPWQTRNETSVLGTLRALRRTPEWLAALLALGATVTIEGEVPLVQLLDGTVTGEVTALHIPTPDSLTRWGEARVGRTPADEPIVAAFAVVRMRAGAVDEARLALTGVWPESVRLTEAPGLLIGGSLTKDRIRKVAAAAEEEVEPRGDYLGSAAYRRAMAGVLTRRALEACAAPPTAGGGE
jgi:CO/xanthine dehydrogenase FAD-binding subunit